MVYQRIVDHFEENYKAALFHLFSRVQRPKALILSCELDAVHSKQFLIRPFLVVRGPRTQRRKTAPGVLPEMYSLSMSRPVCVCVCVT